MVTTVLHETFRIGEYLVSEAEGYRSRETGTVAGGTALVAGTVLGKVTVGGKYVPVAPAAADGSQLASAILYQGMYADDGDTVLTLTARDSEVNGNCLTWPTGITGPQKTTAIGQLAALGIIVRA